MHAQWASRWMLLHMQQQVRVDVTAAILNTGVISKKSVSANRCVFTWKNNPVKFHPDLIKDDRIVGRGADSDQGT